MKQLKNMKDYVVYWLTGSQTLYGDDVLAHVAQHSEEMANYVNERMPVTVKYLTTCKSSDEVVEAIKRSMRTITASVSSPGAIRSLPQRCGSRD